MKKLIAGILFVGMMFAFTGCEFEQSVDQAQSQAQSQILAEANVQTGMPNIKNFAERKMMKEVLEKCDDPKLVTYLYTTAMDGKLIYQGKGIGFGIPYSVQYTNPMYTASSYSGGYEILPQADPSGLFKPDGLSATWYMMIDEKTGESYVEYFEPEIVVKQHKAPRRLCAEWSLPSDY